MKYLYMRMKHLNGQNECRFRNDIIKWNAVIGMRKLKNAMCCNNFQWIHFGFSRAHTKKNVLVTRTTMKTRRKDTTMFHIKLRFEIIKCRLSINAKQQWWSLFYNWNNTIPTFAQDRHPNEYLIKLYYTFWDVIKIIISKLLRYKNCCIWPLKKHMAFQLL